MSYLDEKQRENCRIKDPMEVAAELLRYADGPEGELCGDQRE